MTLLSIAEEVAVVIGVEVPETIASNTSREVVELLAVINSMAAQISGGYNWEKLAALATFTGDGAALAFDKPADYSRMELSAHLRSTEFQGPLTKIESLDQWLQQDIDDLETLVNSWIMYGDQFHIKPAISSGQSVKFFYQKDTRVKATDGSLKTSFTLDTDTFVLSEELLRLGTIWRWKENKGQAYAENLADYEVVKARLIAADGGPNSISIGMSRRPKGTSLAYPKSISV